jgi:8-oxo-dGTP diphosphatase
MKYSTCVYLVHENTWLFLKRTKKKNDVNHNKYIGVGGKVEKNESFEQCAIREVYEETGYKVHQLKFCGQIIFHYPHLEDEVCTIYQSHDYSGIRHECDEGQLVEVSEEDIFSLDLWEGDRIFLKRMLNDSNEFYFEFYYNEKDQLISYTEKTI